MDSTDAVDAVDCSDHYTQQTDTRESVDTAEMGLYAHRRRTEQRSHATEVARAARGRQLHMLLRFLLLLSTKRQEYIFSLFSQSNSNKRLWRGRIG